ncbi:MAG: ATP-binding protein [Parachlamydia sp.]|nr:ATP-binding protein [Parachlamydia sp.]
MSMQQITKEIRNQLTNTPSHFEQPVPPTLHRARREEINRQIDQAISENCPLIFLLGPLGVGKTTQCHYFLKTQTAYRSVSKSFSKINNLEFAFLNLTSLRSRSIFISIAFLIGLLAVFLLPPSGALPFMLTLGYLFAKNSSNLIYILHEALDSMFHLSPKIVLIDDLERSSLTFNDQWALLANLWQAKVIYIVCLGYPPDSPDVRDKMIEYAMKLNGRVIEVLPDEKTNYHILKQFNGSNPFKILLYKGKPEGWMSLFTPREIQILYNLVMTRVKQEGDRRGVPAGKWDIKIMAVNLFLKHLVQKFKWAEGEALFDQQKHEIQVYNHPSPLPGELFYLMAFVESLDFDSPITLNLQPPQKTMQEIQESSRCRQLQNLTESANLWGF